MSERSASDSTASDHSASIVVVGSVNIDLFTQVARHPSPGETLHGSGGEMLPGGKGANQAVAAAKLGGDVVMVGAVGSDAQAQVALDALREAGVRIEAVREVEGPTGLAVVTVAEGGENTIVVVPGANGTVDAVRVREHADLLADAAIVVVQGETPRDGIEAVPELISGRLLHNPAPVMELDPSALRASDPLVVNEHEAALVLEQLTGDGAATHAGSGETAAEQTARLSPEQLVTGLRRAGIRSVVLTLGAQGALLSEGDDGSAPEHRAGSVPGDGSHDGSGSAPDDEPGLIRIPPAPVETVDTTGAGDAFIGALAVGLARGESLARAARLASRVGAFAATGHGAQPSYPGLGTELPALAETD